uniref:Uncharacterized protein n=1 Tax=Ciona intestinalis TaxID=7719 RepID=H2XYG7_CIOIN
MTKILLWFLFLFGSVHPVQGFISLFPLQVVTESLRSDKFAYLS